MGISIELIEVAGFKTAIHGMRNPLQSHMSSDTVYDLDKIPQLAEEYSKGNSSYEAYDYWLNDNFATCHAAIGPKDLKLMQHLISNGTDESKFMRQIYVSMNIIADRYWWPEFDQYKVGTVTNSESTMHTLTKFPITAANFGFDNTSLSEEEQKKIIDYIEGLRQKYLKTQSKEDWYSLIAALPQAWLQKRTVTLNYAVLRNIYFARRHHRLLEWREFCNFIEELPYGLDLICWED